MRYHVGHHSLRGARANNQDRATVAERLNGVLMVVADGLGGHRGGELAAETLTDTLTRAFKAVRTPVIDRPSAFLALAILQAHDAVVMRGRQHTPPLEPRTTCIACLVQEGYAYWAHVGDSRLYHFRRGRLLTRTQDHTSVEQLRESGLLTEEEMQGHPHKSRLNRCVGGPNPPSVSLGEETRLERGDTLLLVSDGVWEALAAEELAGFAGYPNLDEGIEEMLIATQRKMREHCDNISAVVMRWEDETTRAAPRQGNRPVEINRDHLWRSAPLSRGPRPAAAPPTERTEAKPAAPTTDRRGTIDSDIDELEAWLNKIEPKRRDP